VAPPQGEEQSGEKPDLDRFNAWNTTRPMPSAAARETSGA
jgi:hypothetical protein